MQWTEPASKVLPIRFTISKLILNGNR
jgi:hypothetical protein